MELKEFIKKALVDITTGVDEASEQVSRKIELNVKDNNRNIEFDIAVSVEESSSGSAKAGLKVLQFVEAGGGINTESKNSTISRIKFDVFVANYTFKK